MKIGYLLLCSLTAAVGAEVPERRPLHRLQTGSGGQHWSYQPVKRPEVPQVQQKEWVRTPIDAFILAKLWRQGHQGVP